MLVLTRKTEEQILIGDDIKITLLRVRGNSVRIGIDAPREMRVVRGELKPKASEEADFELSDREQVFAHPQVRVISGRFKVPESLHPKSQPVSAASQSAVAERPGRAPLAGFMSAT